MCPEQRALVNIAGAVNALGWIAQIRKDDGAVTGMVIGKAEYVSRIDGALVLAALHGMGDSETAGNNTTPGDAIDITVGSTTNGV